MTTDQQDVGFEISTQQRAALAGAADAAPRRTQVVVDMVDAIDPDVLVERLTRVAGANEILRTTFVRPVGAGRHLQIVHESSLAVVDPTVEVDAAASVEDAAAAAWDADLDSISGPLVRVTPVADADGRLHLVLTGAAAVADAESLGLLAGMLSGTAHVVPDPLQYADYAAWQGEQAPIPASDGKPTFVPPSVANTGGEAPSSRPGSAVVADMALAGQISNLAVEAGIDAPDVWSGLFSVFASRVGGLEDVVLGLGIRGRSGDEDLATALGPFAETVPVAVHVDATSTVAEMARAITAIRATAEGPAGSKLEGEAPAALCTTWQPDADTRWTPDMATAQLHLVAGPGGATLWWNATLVSTEYGGRVARAIRALASAAVLGGLDGETGALDGVDPGEAARIEGPRPGPSRPLVHLLLAEQARRDPERPALASGDVVVSYGQLDRRVNALAAELSDRGVGRGDVVAVLMDRSIEAVMAIFGVLRAGAAHLCVNADQPVGRLTAQLDHPDVRVLLVSEEREELAREVATSTGVEVTVVTVDGAERDDPPFVESDPSDLAYIVATSGTSGAPKAVAVTHRGVSNYTEHIAGLIGDVTGDSERLTFGIVSSLSTDLANTCLYPAVALGGCIQLVPQDDVVDPSRFADYVSRHPIDILKVTPSLLAALLEAGPEVLPTTILFTGGEVATWQLYDRVRELGKCRIFNHYGPSETTVGSLVYDVASASPTDRLRPSVPIGYPITDTAVVVLDDRLRPVAPGMVGQIAIGGAGLARGYLGDEVRTAEVFVDDPTEKGGRLYLTGDQGRRLPSGAVEFLGRVDGQVKVRGYRVETAEVEIVLRDHPEVSRAAVIVREEREADPRLVAYIVSPYSQGPPPSVLRDHLSTRLPSYMVPSAFVAVASLPLTANGKLDRAALPAPGSDDVESGAEFVEPSTSSERMVAEIFSELLIVDQVGAGDDFFALGGHSLLATQAVARIRKATGVSLQVHQLFNEPTVGGLAGVVDTMLVTVDDADDDELRDLLSELEEMSDEEAEALLAAESDDGGVT